MPNIFAITVGNNSKPFQCSDSFVGHFVKDKLKWSKCKATQASQKLPADAEDQMEACAFQLTVVITDHNIPDACVVNGNQTGNTYSQSGQMTYTETGIHQVAAVGKEVKRTFTIMIEISIREVLLF